MSQYLTPDPVALHALGLPDRPACHNIASGRRWSYRELDVAIQRAVAWLRDEHGITPGARIASVAHNSVDLLIVNLAAERLGAIFAPLNYRLAAAELATILDDCRPALIIADDIERLPEPPAAAWRAINHAELAGAIAARAPAPRCPPRPADQACIILYTSGTSGTPKGVIVTGQNIYATAVNFGLIGDVTKSSVFLCEAPMFHVIGLLPSLRSPLLHGAYLHLAPGFDPERSNRFLADAGVGVSHYFCVPKMADMLAEQANFAPAQWRRLKALFTGGSPVSAPWVRAWLERGVLVSNGFGMTEAGTIMHVPLERELIDATAGSVGLPPPFVAVRLVDEAGAEVAAGQQGEILVRGPNVTPGYWNRPDETARAFTADGWLRTGDIGQTDAYGFVTLRDRKKDMFISGGENVFPTEVEHALLEHPVVAEAAVIGVADDAWGEVGHAYVVAAAGRTVDAETLRRHCEAYIARYKIPRRVTVVDHLPRTASGKLLKQRLKQPPPAAD